MCVCYICVIVIMYILTMLYLSYIIYMLNGMLYLSYIYNVPAFVIPIYTDCSVILDSLAKKGIHLHLVIISCSLGSICYNHSCEHILCIDLTIFLTYQLKCRYYD